MVVCCDSGGGECVAVTIEINWHHAASRELYFPIFVGLGWRETDISRVKRAGCAIAPTLLSVFVLVDDGFVRKGECHQDKEKGPSWSATKDLFTWR